MASDNSVYPPLLRIEVKGKQSKSHSMNHCCLLNNFGVMREGLGEDVWDILKSSTLGVFLKLSEVEYTWAANRVHYLLMHQLAINNIHEIWSVFGGQPIRFSLNEFAEITGLNCDPIDERAKCDANHEAFWSELGLKSPIGPTFSELKQVMDRCKTWSIEKKLMVGRLCILSVGVFGINHGSRIPFEDAKRVLEPDAFEKYPWGRVAFSSLIKSIKVHKCTTSTFSLQGCVHVLLIWLYESVPFLADMYGNRRDTTDVPLLNWRSSRQRFDMDDLIRTEMSKNDGKISVRHMVPVTAESMYPEWSDNHDCEDPLLDNLIRDVINGQVREDAWNVKREEKIKKQKEDVQLTDSKSAKGVESLRKRKKKEDNEEDADLMRTKKKKKTICSDEIDELMKKQASKKVEDVAIVGVLKMIEKLTETIEGVGKKVADRMDSFQSKVTKRLEKNEATMSKRMSAMEKDIKLLHDRNCHEAAKYVGESNRKDDDANSTAPAPSWLVEANQNAKEEFPINRSVHMTKVGQSAKEGQRKRDITKTYHLKKKVKVEPKEASKKVVEKKTIQEVSDIEDVTDQVAEENLKMASSFEETETNPMEEMAEKAVGLALDGILNAITNLDGGTPKMKRVPQLAESQKMPFIGNSTVKRIIGVTPSQWVYNPFEKVEENKYAKLMEFLEEDEEQPLSSSNASTRFYWEIITLRKDWPSPDFGWLGCRHMLAAMAMFRKRLMSNRCPFHDQRITFLDQDFVNNFIYDYKQFDMGPKKFLFRQFYIDHANGVLPADSPTNKKWFIDVDRIFACHHIKGDHWVALEIDLPKKRIFVYDSIPKHASDRDLVASCQPFRRMIPYLLSTIIPDNVRKKSNATLDVKRVTKDVPRNLNPGDCGVYTIKYIECRALGVSFEGLSDSAMPDIRRRLAAEIFDEVPEPIGPAISDPHPRADDFLIPHLRDTQ